MFTGIIETTGEIVQITPTATGARLAVRASNFWSDAVLGASIAIDGVCLTITARQGDISEFDVVRETLARTTLATARNGGRVNLERAMRGDSRLDGHFVQGHVEGVGAIDCVDRQGGEQRWWFRVPTELGDCMIPKGSVAIDGISLTIAEVEAERIAVALIPTTLGVTTLGAKRPGDGVNLETDMLVRAVVRVVRQMGASMAGVPMEQLRAAGMGA